MHKFSHVFFILLAFLLVSRCFELWLAKRNEKILLKDHKAVLAHPWEYYWVVGFHILWLGSLMIESWHNHHLSQGPLVAIAYFLLFVAQALRLESMHDLGVYWTTKIYRTKQAMLVRKGIYKWMAHPSYLAVILEFFALPYLFGAYWTLLIFFPINLLIIAYRIKLEYPLTRRWI